MIDEALELAIKYKFAIFPVEVGGKKPLIKGWPKLATSDPLVVEQWWSAWPDANIGIVTGLRSGIDVIDVDVKTGGIASLKHLQRQGKLPEKATVRTGGGGLHFYIERDPKHPLKNTASKIAPGIDTRGDGGYVVAPPSLHPSGNRYEWIL